MSLFSHHLESLLRDTRKTLDQLAGILIDVKHPQVLKAVSRLLSQAPPPHVEKKDLKIGQGSDAKLGGTVIAVHQFLSPEFLAYYLVNHGSSCRISDRHTRRTGK
jgi:hypothetical protein